jgi:zinc transporter ZupT
LVSLTSHPQHLYSQKRFLFDSDLSSSKNQFFGDDLDNQPNAQQTPTTDAPASCPQCTTSTHIDETRLSYIGYALSGGFLFMLIVEKLSASFGGDGHGHGHGHAHDAHQDEKEAIELESPGSESRRRRDSPNSISASGRTNAASIGLIVHCAVDGIAMGSVAASHNSSQEFIVFLAILLHKAPSALGISTFLVQRRLSHRRSKFKF